MVATPKPKKRGRSVFFGVVPDVEQQEISRRELSLSTGGAANGGGLPDRADTEGDHNTDGATTDREALVEAEKVTAGRDLCAVPTDSLCLVQHSDRGSICLVQHSFW